MITSKQVKSIARKRGADLCGIASIGRFNGAPRGFSPRDIYPDTVSVIVIACRAHSEIKNKRGADIYVCNICRTVCPFRAGIA